MLRVCVERWNQRCSFAHDANLGMMMAVNATFMQLRQAEPTLKIQVIMRIIRQFGTGEKTDLKD